MKRFYFLLGFLLLTRLCFGAPSNSVSTPNSFTAGTTIQSTQVNADFTHIQNTYNTHTHTDITLLGTVTVGVWNGTPIGVQFGGLGINSSTVPQGSIIYYNGTGTILTLPASTSGHILTTQGSGSNPVWSGNFTGTHQGYNASTISSATVLMVSDTVGYVNVFLKIYDSGWFAVVANTTYTKTHNLGTTKVIYKVFISDQSDGSGNCTGGVGDYVGGKDSEICALSTTTITIRTSDNLVDIADSAGNRWNPTSGYARVIIIAL